MRGVYYGLYAPTNGIIDHVGSGYFTFNMRDSGIFSGKISGNSGTYPFVGQFDLAGHAQSMVMMAVMLMLMLTMLLLLLLMMMMTMRGKQG